MSSSTTSQTADHLAPLWRSARSSLASQGSQSHGGHMAGFAELAHPHPAVATDWSGLKQELHPLIEGTLRCIFKTELRKVLETSIAEVGENVQRDIREEFKHWLGQEQLPPALSYTTEGGRFVSFAADGGTGSLSSSYVVQPLVAPAPAVAAVASAAAPADPTPAAAAARPAKPTLVAAAAATARGFGGEDRLRQLGAGNDSRPELPFAATSSGSAGRASQPQRRITDQGSSSTGLDLLPGMVPGDGAQEKDVEADNDFFPGVSGPCSRSSASSGQQAWTTNMISSSCATDASFQHLTNFKNTAAQQPTVSSCRRSTALPRRSRASSDSESDTPRRSMWTASSEYDINREAAQGISYNPLRRTVQESLGLAAMKRKQERKKKMRRRVTTRNDALDKPTRKQSATDVAIMKAKMQANRRASFSEFMQTWEATGKRPGCVDAAAWLVQSDQFDYSMGVVLLANAALFGVQANYFAQTKVTQVPLSFRILDGAFCIVFTLELVARFLVSRSNFFHGEEWKWNVFDLVVISFQVLDEIVKLVWSEGGPVKMFFDSFGVIRMLRLARLMRLVRMVRLIPELKSMVYLIFASIGSFFWSMILIVIIMYCFAIYYTEIVTDMMMLGAEDIPSEELISLEDKWGSVATSILSLWMAITGGDDWRNFIVVLKYDGVYALHVFLFVIYIAFGTLVMLNLVTGVFVEGAQRIIREDKDTELLNMASTIFRQADQDGSFDITWEEFNEQLESGSMDEYIKAIGIGIQEAEHLYDLLDRDSSGTVSIAEFVRGCLRLRGPAKSMDLAEMEYKMRESFCHLAMITMQLRDLMTSNFHKHDVALQELLRAKSKGALAAQQEASQRVDPEQQLVSRLLMGAGTVDDLLRDGLPEHFLADEVLV